ncbi:hypothetical protein [Natranaeroarchaeum sulfidigenes]|uniref:Putative membrane protein n=1 Tax=Natranaeroarchaeum sulfidigenes TaxID=2784880 RepID=A0A897MNP6_9EURY|nr:hypothetical protein [Natranaeroarchaeum sulfidigenes]QSG01981.1 putative membrane protein [Natranaeroarchaeum sulfidigenes]
MTDSDSETSHEVALTESNNGSPPTIPSRSRRLVAYLQYNRKRILTDTAVLATWVLLTSSIFSWIGLPNWLLYVVIFTGVVVYARATPTWERPYRSPD